LSGPIAVSLSPSQPDTQSKKNGEEEGERSTKIQIAAFISVGFKPFSFFENFTAKSGYYNRFRLYLLQEILLAERVRF
jgi:hypothetical protein